MTWLMFWAGFWVGSILALWAHGKDVRRALNRKGSYIGWKYRIQGVSLPAPEATDSLDSGEGRANTKVPSELARSAPSKKGNK